MKTAFTLLRNLVKPFLVIIIIAACIETVHAQTTYTWKGTTSTDWNTASNWSPASVPTATSIVQIGFSTFTNAPTISSTETVSAASISFGTVKSATLTLNGNLTVTGNISMASASIFSMSNTSVLTLGGNFSSGTLKFPTSSTAKIILNGTAAQYFPTTTTMSGNVGYLDDQNTYYGSATDKGVELLNNVSGTYVTINYLYVENNAIFNANATLVEGTGYHCTIGQHAIYISRSTFNFHSNDVIDPTSTLEFTATNQVINMVKFNAGLTNIPPNVLFTGTNITVNAGTAPNNASVFKVLGTLGVINTTNTVTFDPQLTLIDIGDNFTGNGALSSGSLPINIAGSWLNTATYNVGGVVTYNGNNIDSAQIVATSPNYQKDVVFTGVTPKTVSSGTMMVGGNLDNSAGTNVNFITNSSTLLMDGSGTQYIKGGTATNTTFPKNVVSGTIFDNVTVATTGSSPNVTLQGNNNISPLGVLTISNAPASLNATSANSLTLMSDSTGSASFATLPLGCSISGTVNVQRYVEGSSNNLSKRGYRLVSSPVYTGSVSGTNVFDLSWLLNGAIITGPVGGGFFSVGNPSSYIYREDIAPSNSNFTTGNWKGIAALNNTPAYNIGSQKRLTKTNINDTTVNIPVGNGILFFFRGNKTLSNGTTSGTKTSQPFNYPENVIFTNTGTLNTGTVNVKLWYRQDNYLGYTNSPSLNNTTVRGYNMVGNPYASTINWEKFNRNSTVANSSIYGGGNLCSTIWMFNPTNKQYEAYMQKTTAITSADTVSNLDPGTAVGSASNMIASGQAFVVQASSATQTLSFRETAKTNTQPSSTKLNVLMGMPKATASTEEPLIRLQMSLDSISTDEIVVRLNNNASPTYVQTEDAVDLGGLGAAVALSAMSSDSSAVALAIDRLPFPTQTTQQIISLYTNVINSGSYQLKLTQLTNLPGVYQVILRDKFLQDSVIVHSGSSYPFTIDLTNPATFGYGRFQLVISQSPLDSLRLITFNGQKTSNGSLLKWKVKNEYNTTTFFIERSTDDGQTFQPIGSVYSDASGNYDLLDKNPVNGENQYRLKILDFNGNITYSKIVSITYTSWQNLISNINVYPNPTASVLNLSVNQNFSLSSLKISSYQIKIVNSFGVVVKQATSQQSTWNANISDLQPGTYIVQVTNADNNGVVGSASFIKY